jgi:hypothetical protein
MCVTGLGSRRTAEQLPNYAYVWQNGSGCMVGAGGVNWMGSVVEAAPGTSEQTVLRLSEL